MLHYAALSFVMLASACGLLSENKSIEQVTEKCMKKLAISEKEFEIMMNSSDPLAIDACVLGCVLKDIGLIDEEGMIDDKELKDFYDKYVKEHDKHDRLAEVGKICIDVNDKEVTDGTKGCERALLFTECFMKQSEVMLDMS